MFPSYRNESIDLPSKWKISNENYKSSRSEVFCKKTVLRNFIKSTGKHLCKSLLFTKYAGFSLFRTQPNIWDRRLAKIVKGCVNYHCIKYLRFCPYTGEYGSVKNPYSRTFYVGYIFTSLFYKREHFWNKEKCFLFHFESSFRSSDNQILDFQIFKCNDVIKNPSMKHETYFIE